MIALDIQHISKSYDGVPVLRDLAFGVEKGSKTALIGVNGAGKTTLMRLITGAEEADEGQVVIASELKVGYLAQDRNEDTGVRERHAQTDELSPDKTIYDVLSSGKSEVIALDRQLTEEEHALSGLSGDELDRALAQTERLRQRFEEMEGYAWRGQIIGVARGLGFEERDLDRRVDSLSGGEYMRVALGAVLLRDADILLLDEPTNHLDISSIQWLENYLARLKQTIIVISHDRYFLDRVVDHVVEIERGRARAYKGNYTDFAQKKKKIRDAEMKEYLKQQQEIKHQEAVIEKLRQFNREKSIRRAESREKMLAKMDVIDRPEEELTGMHLRFTPNVRSGDEVMDLSGISAAFDGRYLFADVDLHIRRGEHVALIGDNGTGKSTLLKMLVEDKRASRDAASDTERKSIWDASLGVDSSGSVTWGTGVEIGYYDQEQALMDGERTLFEEIRETYPDMNDTRIRNTLAAFLFTGDDVFKQIRELSGGEKGRLSLAKLMLSGANLLVLDEPTNHLDILGKEVLEDALRDYEGTLLFVSHDRYFIGQVAGRIWDLDGGRIDDYNGDYEYYLAHVEERRGREIDKRRGAAASQDHQTSSPEDELSDTSRTEKIVQPDTQRETAAEGGKLSWEEQKKLRAAAQKRERDLSACEKRIAELEAREQELTDMLADPDIATDGARLREIAAEQESVADELIEQMQRWEELAESVTE